MYRTALDIVRQMAVVLALSAPAAAGGAHTLDPGLEGLPIAELEQIYLVCERQAAEGERDRGWAMHCSTAYEILKRRAFDGDFRRLKEWADSRAYDITPDEAPAGARGGDRF